MKTIGIVFIILAVLSFIPSITNSQVLESFDQPVSLSVIFLCVGITFLASEKRKRKKSN
ncbi:hypothetical protein [Priestia endophytica]|uniref:hypothetical protein n=1 Tax=Priestia endophytica TaxID=135735 RepID=UPI001559828F|nr:hypothetical protein [Priestia endophytica]